MGLRSLFSLGKSAGLGLLAIGLVFIGVGLVLWLVHWILTIIMVVLGVLVAFLGFEVYSAAASAEEVYQTASDVAPVAYSAFDGWVASRRKDRPNERRLPSEYAPNAVKDLARRYVDPFLAPGRVPSGGAPSGQLAQPGPAQYQQYPPQQASHQPRPAPASAGSTGGEEAGPQDVPRFCQWCGAELSPRGRFCPGCGHGR